MAEDLVSTAAENAIEAVREAIADAYKQGFKDGHRQAVRSIMNAVNNDLPKDDVPARPQVGLASTPRAEGTLATRAPRGSVRPVVLRIVASREPAGAKTSEIQNSIGNFSHGDISRLSVANELRRQKGTLYRQDADGNWHLTEAGEDAATDPEKDRAPEPSASLTGALDTNQETEQMPPP